MPFAAVRIAQKRLYQGLSLNDVGTPSLRATTIFVQAPGCTKILEK